MKLNLNTLESVARAATPGPWRHETDEYGERYKVASWAYEDETPGICGDYSRKSWPLCEADATFIATLNPQTVLALVEATRGLVEAVKRHPMFAIPDDGSSRSWGVDDDEAVHAALVRFAGDEG